MATMEHIPSEAGGDIEDEWPNGQFMLSGRLPIGPKMTVSGVSSSVSSYQSAAAVQTERAVLVMKKQQDVRQAEAQALVDLIKASSPNGDVGTRISVYG